MCVEQYLLYKWSVCSHSLPSPHNDHDLASPGTEYRPCKATFASHSNKSFARIFGVIRPAIEYVLTFRDIKTFKRSNEMLSHAGYAS